MNIKRDNLVVIISAILITALFYRQPPGLNLFFFESVFFIWLLVTKQFRYRGLYPITLASGLLITSLFTILTHSLFSYFIHFLVLFLFIGILIYPDAKSLVVTLGLSLAHIFNSQLRFLKELSGSKLKGRKVGSYIWRFRIFIIPVIIIIFFIIIYRKSNPFFNTMIESIGIFINKYLNILFKDLDFWIIATFLISLVISVFLFIRTSVQRLIQTDADSNEELKRKRRKVKRNVRFNALKNEYKAGVFLLFILNLVILILNVIDIRYVWFNFDWEGQYLKQFVHEGTYLLILSILISIILVLYYFRGNLNFYRNNRLLKFLSLIWLMQNGILTISVAIRNFWYIKYFALAYKRIGVIIFLVLTIYGLYTVFRKVWHRKSAFFLFKTNSYALLLILMISSVINWDTVIAKYNFGHYKKSFVHLDYLSTLSDKSLPYLDKSLRELRKIESVQKDMFPFEKKYMDSEEYYNMIKYRKKAFRRSWESKGFLSWNLPEYMAYRKLYRKK